MAQPKHSTEVHWGGKRGAADKDHVQALWSEKGLAGLPDDEAAESMQRQMRLVTYALTLDALSHYVERAPGRRTLEIGCGWGRIFMGMKQRYPDLDYTGIDLTPNLVELCAANAKSNDIAEPYEHFVGDAEQLAFDNASYDLAYSVRVFQYVPNPDHAVKEALRVLRPGGWFALLLPNGSNPIRRRTYGKTTLPTAGTMRRWFADAGFEAIETRFLGFMPIVRYLPMRPLDRLAETVGKLPGLRRFGVHAVVAGRKPRA